MRTAEDAVRSLSTRRYIASIMGSPPWRVRMGMDGRFRRPIVLVQLSAGTGYSHGGVQTAMITANLTVQIYPEIGNSGSESKILAERAADILATGMLLGVQDAKDSTVRGYRERIPLWDFTDEEGNPLPLEGSGSVATKRTVHDYLWVAPGWRFITIPEAPDDQLFTAIADISVQWFRNAYLNPPGPVMTDAQVDVTEVT